MQISGLQLRGWAKMGQCKAFFSIGIPEVAVQYPNMYVVAADMGSYSGMDRFFKRFPQKAVNVGIQEQNMIGAATGLALEGNLVYAGSYAAFSAVRPMEQIRQNLSVLGANVKLVGYSAGYSMETLGRSHWATEDIAFMRSLPNMTVISAADSLEAVKACMAVASFEGPAYVRLCGGSDCPMVYKEDYSFEIGKAVVLKEGRDTVLIATGRMVYEALQAAETLQQQGIDAGVINTHTIKPLDMKVIVRALKQYQRVFTIEEHNVIGGLGSAVADCACEVAGSALITKIGMQDRHYELGCKSYIWQQAGLNAGQIVRLVKKKMQED